METKLGQSFQLSGVTNKKRTTSEVHVIKNTYPPLFWMFGKSQNILLLEHTSLYGLNGENLLNSFER